LIATDGSPSALDALELGVEFANEQSSGVTLVHVITKNDLRRGPAFEQPERDEVLRESADVLRKAGIEPELELLSGDPADEITWLADNLEAGLVVIGSRGRGAVQGTLLGSVSRRVLASCSRPVAIRARREGDGVDFAHARGNDDTRDC
jgi:nucleotide-binding universal stress UspA family protein